MPGIQRIAIIGASSFLAHAITDELGKNPDHDLTLYIQKLITDNKDTFHRTRLYDFPRARLEEEEIEFLSGQNVIIFCAGAGVQPDHEESSETIYEINAFEPVRLINQLERVGFTGQLITFGSYFEIGQDLLKKPYNEKDFISHSNQIRGDYSFSKRILTKFIDMKVNQGNLSFSIKHLILTNIYGAGENPSRLLAYITRNLIENREISLTAGTQRRQYTHVRDIAMNLAGLLSSDLSGILNYTDDKIMTVREISEKAVMIAEEFSGNKAKVKFAQLVKRDTAMEYLALDNSRSVVNGFWKSNISLEEGIREYLINYGRAGIVR